MKLGLPISVVLHVVFIGGTALHWGGEVEIKDKFQIIPVEIVNVSDVSNAPQVAPVPTPKPETPKPIENVQQASEDETQEADDLTIQSSESDGKTESAVETTTETVALKDSDAEEETDDTQDSVSDNPSAASSLDDLFGMTEETTQAYADNGGSSVTQTQSEINRQQMDLAAREGELSTSYEDAVMRRIYNQWQIPAGAPDMENLVVTVLVDLSSDGRVTSARLSGDSASKASKDPFYNSAANSALRAVNKAERFEFLPYDQYVKWQSMTLTFYPKNAPSSVPT